MNEFTASNGTRIEKTEYGTWFAAEVIAPDSRVTLAGVHTDALREFFRAEEDERLGRWRWPQGARFVVYPWYNADDPNPRIVIVDEATGGQMTTTRATVSGTDEWAKAARAYFDAHPEPKPWHDAKPGEIWALNVSGVWLGAVREFGPDWKLSNGNFLAPHDGRISDGRRLWPEVQS